MAFRKLHATGFQRRHGYEYQPIDYESALWQFHFSGPGTASLLPPPFMVASAIEELKQSKWGETVEIVPGEADPYCADYARRQGLAILSNDSDMAVYDLGGQGCVLLLQSLERKFVADETQLGALCLFPAQIAKRLHLPGLKSIAFERSVDSSIGLAGIIHRARDQSRISKLSTQYNAFTSKYDLSSKAVQVGSAFSSPESNIDPRVAELLAQILATRMQQSDTAAENWHVYLPFLFEDPSRDAAWTYGAAIRQAAYSLLGTLSSPEATRSQVYEFYRKGTRIAEAHTHVLQYQFLRALIVDICGHFRASIGRLPEGFPLPLAWTLFALREISKQKQSTGKAPPSEDLVWRLLGLVEKSPESTWEDIHLSACIQSVLYSVRILKQSAALLIVRSELHHAGVQEVHDLLQSLPDVVDLMTSPKELASQILAVNLPGAEVAEATLRKAGDASQLCREQGVHHDLANMLVAQSCMSDSKAEKYQRKRKTSTNQRLIGNPFGILVTDTP
jgi:XPG domain containing